MTCPRWSDRAVGIESHIAFQGLGGRGFPHARVGNLLDETSFLQNVNDGFAQNELLLQEMPKICTVRTKAQGVKNSRSLTLISCRFQSFVSSSFKRSESRKIVIRGQAKAGWNPGSIGGRAAPDLIRSSDWNRRVFCESPLRILAPDLLISSFFVLSLKIPVRSRIFAFLGSAKGRYPIYPSATSAMTSSFLKEAAGKRERIRRAAADRREKCFKPILLACAYCIGDSRTAIAGSASAARQLNQIRFEK